jgi:hypothetical protein
LVAAFVVTAALAAQGCGDSAASKPVPTPEKANDIMKTTMKGTGPMTVPKGPASTK